MNAIVECEAIVKSLSPSRSCSTRHSQNICLPTDKYMTTRNVSLENTGFENTKKYSENKKKYSENKKKYSVKDDAGVDKEKVQQFRHNDNVRTRISQSCRYNNI